MRPRRRLLFLAMSVAVFGFGTAFMFLAIAGLPFADASGRGAPSLETPLAFRILAGVFGGMGWLFAAYFLGTALLGREPLHGNRPDLVVETWSAEDARQVTRYRQPTGKTIVQAVVNLFATAMVLSFVVFGLSAGLWWFAVVAGLMGLIIVPGTIWFIARVVSQPWVLELSADGIRVRGHRRYRWHEVDQLRIEDLNRMSARRGTHMLRQNRRLGIVLAPGVPTPSGLSAIALRAAGMGRYAAVGVLEQELPVDLEAVLATAARYRPELRVVGGPVHAADADADSPARNANPSPSAD